MLEHVLHLLKTFCLPHNVSANDRYLTLDDGLSAGVQFRKLKLRSLQTLWYFLSFS